MRPERASTADVETTGAAEEGSAALEFILVGLILLVPIVYLVVALGAIQGQALGVETGARQIARTIANASDPVAAEAAAARVREAIVVEYGLDADAIDVDIACTGSGDACPEPGAMLTVTVTTSVSLPLVPALFDLDRLARVPVESTSVQKVSRFWGTEP